MEIRNCGWCGRYFDAAHPGDFYCSSEHADLDHRRMKDFATRDGQPLAEFSTPVSVMRSAPRPAAATAPRKVTYISDAFEELVDQASKYPESDRVAGILSRNVQVAAPLERR